MVTPPPFDSGNARVEITERLAEARDRALKAGVSGTSHIGTLPAAYCVADKADDLSSELIVVGTHGHRGLRRLALGSVAEKIVQLAPCSVLTVKGEKGSEPPRKILVGVDFSESSNRSVAVAAELAANCGASLHLVHALEPQMLATAYDMQLPLDFMDDLRHGIHEKLEALAAGIDPSVSTSWTTTEHTPRYGLVRLAEEESFDLIVTGSHGRTGISHAFLGSVAERVLRDSPCSVWTVRNV